MFINTICLISGAAPSGCLSVCLSVTAINTTTCLVTHVMSCHDLDLLKCKMCGTPPLPPWPGQGRQPSCVQYDMRVWTGLDDTHALNA